MPERKDAVNPDIIYVYDGSFAGFLCCVFESVYSKMVPLGIEADCECQTSLAQKVYIEMDSQKEERVRRSVPLKISDRALELIENVFMTCLDKKEMHLLRFMLFGYKKGRTVCDMFGHPLVFPLLEAEKHLLSEVHLLKGFVRFSDYGGILGAEIDPKNFVLPHLLPHFCARYNAERFMIYDKTHGAALIYENGNAGITAIENVKFPEASGDERAYREMWKRFYNTISIAARENPRCRMSHMPKRYWRNMLEVSELI